MPREEFRSEEQAMEEARRMEEITGYSFDIVYNGESWEVFQEEGNGM